jgi:hypothetical protein
MAPNPRIANFANRGLKLETAATVEDIFLDFDLEHTEKIVLTGNTFGVAAGEALGKVIRCASIPFHPSGWPPIIITFAGILEHLSDVIFLQFRFTHRREPALAGPH